MEKKITLSIEQMKHLESLGLDITDASLVGATEQLDFTTEYSVNRYSSLGGHPMEAFAKYNPFYAYTLEDILNLLPNTITYIHTKRNITAYLGLHTTDGERYIGYFTNGGVKSKIDFDSDNMLLNAYNLLLWCIENNYIKTNKV